MKVLYWVGVGIFFFALSIAGALTRATSADEDAFGVFSNLAPLLLSLTLLYIGLHVLGRNRPALADEERRRADRKAAMTLGGIGGTAVVLFVVQSIVSNASPLAVAVVLVIAAGGISYAWFVGRALAAKGSRPADAVGGEPRLRDSGTAGDAEADAGSAHPPAGHDPRSADPQAVALETAESPSRSDRFVLLGVAVGTLVVVLVVAASLDVPLPRALGYGLGASGFLTLLVMALVLKSETRILRNASGESPLGGGPVTRAVTGSRAVDLTPEQERRAVAFATSIRYLHPWTGVVFAYFFAAVAVGLTLLAMGDPDAPAGASLYYLLAPAGVGLLAFSMGRQYRNAGRFLARQTSSSSAARTSTAS
ncbi:MAG: hypothetical protein ABWZ77_03180 [Naasia sp.]